MLLTPNTARLLVDMSRTSVRQLSSYKRWEISRYSSNFESLAMRESNVIPPVNGPHELLIKVHAASINPLDIAVSTGYGQNVLRLMRLADNVTAPQKLTYDKFPMTLGRDFAGTVVRKGSQVSHYQVGDCVWGVVPPHSTGSHANYVVAKESHVKNSPNHSFIRSH